MHTNPDLLALLALGEQVDSPDELAHLSGCSECQAELQSLRAAADLGRRTTEEDALTTPPPHVWQRISAELGLGGAAAVIDPPGPPATDRVGVASAAPDRRGLRAAAFVLAAALALVVGIGIGTNLDRVAPADVEVTSVQLNALPSYAGSSGQAFIEEGSDGTRTLVVQITSPTPVTGQREVWLTNTVADPMVSMGYLTEDSGRFPISPSMDVSRTPLVDVSQEPKGDSDPEHSGASMLRGKFSI